MKRIAYFVKVLIGFLVGYESIILKASIESVKNWTNLLFLKYLYLVFFYCLDFLFFLLGVILLMDGVYALFVGKSFIPELKDRLHEQWEGYFD